MRGFFRVVLILIASMGALFGMAAMSEAKSAIHEIEALICGVIVAIAAGAGLVASAIDEAARRTLPTADAPSRGGSETT